MHATPPGWPRLSPALFYDDAAAAIAWLERAFGFETRLRVDRPDGGVAHSELVYGDAVVMVASASAKDRRVSPRSVGGGTTQGLFLYVDDIEAHFVHAREAGGTVLQEPTTSDYGAEYWCDRGYEMTDPEGHRWYFAQRLRSA